MSKSVITNIDFIKRLSYYSGSNFLKDTQMQNVNMSSALNTYLEDLDFKITHPDEIKGLPTGLQALDKKIEGFLPGEVVLIGARPAMGKTSFVINIAYNIALYFSDQNKINPADDRCVLYFNLAESTLQIVERFIALNSEMSRYTIKREFADPSVQTSIKKACTSLDQMPIFFSNNGYDVEAIIDEIKRTSAQKQVGCVILDYLQLIGRSQYKEDFTPFMEQIKDLATKLDIPFVVLTQLSRTLENRSCKIPLVSDIRGFNKKQDAADKIIFLYREIYYTRYQEPEKKKRETDAHFQQRYKEWKERCAETENECRVIVARNKNGACAYEKVKFIPEYGKFTDWDNEYYY